MAEQILSGQDIRGLFLVIDDCQQNALVLVKQYYETLTKKAYNVQIINESRPDVLSPTNAHLSTLSSPYVWPPAVDKVPSTVLVLHSVELLLALGGHDIERLPRDLLHWLALDNVSQVVCVANHELTDVTNLRRLEYICCQRLKLLSCASDTFVVDTLWKKPRGKAIQQKENIRVLEGGVLKFSIIKDTVQADNKKPTPAPSSSSTELLFAGLTFNVNTSQQERKDRDQLVLPYTEAGQISYTLDREDDFDEEDDPDDDLDI